MSTCGGISVSANICRCGLTLRRRRRELPQLAIYNSLCRMGSCFCPFIVIPQIRWRISVVRFSAVFAGAENAACIIKSQGRARARHRLLQISVIRRIIMIIYRVVRKDDDLYGYKRSAWNYGDTVKLVRWIQMFVAGLFLGGIIRMLFGF